MKNFRKTIVKRKQGTKKRVSRSAKRNATVKRLINSVLRTTTVKRKLPSKWQRL